MRAHGHMGAPMGAPGYGAPGYGAPGYGAPGMMPGMAGGMAPGMGGGYWRSSVKMDKKDLKRLCEQAFLKYDMNRSGSLSLQEFYPAFQEVCALSRCPPPSQAELNFVFNKYNNDWNREVSFKEFKRICKELFGYESKKHGRFF